MQRPKINYLSPAKTDIVNIGRYHLEKVGPASAKKITDMILDSIDQLSSFPLMGATHPDPLLAAKGYRKLVVSAPYVCVYKVLDDGVYIYRIVNGAMDYPKLLPK
jgi:addiction module RelE/StbE family toxin